MERQPPPETVRVAVTDAGERGVVFVLLLVVRAPVDNLASIGDHEVLIELLVANPGAHKRTAVLESLAEGINAVLPAEHTVEAHATLCGLVRGVNGIGLVPVRELVNEQRTTPHWDGIALRGLAAALRDIGDASGHLDRNGRSVGLATLRLGIVAAIEKQHGCGHLVDQARLHGLADQRGSVLHHATGRHSAGCGEIAAN